MSVVQLNIALEKIENPLQQALADGRFVYLAECHVPEDERSLPQAAERIMPLAEKMWSFDDLCGGLAILDLPESPFSAIELLSALPENNRNRNCAFLSGSGRNTDDIWRSKGISKYCLKDKTSYTKGKTTDNTYYGAA